MRTKDNNEIQKMPNIPETMILVSNTHGLVPIVSKNNKTSIDASLKYMKLPTDVTLTKLDVVALGVPNISTLENTNKVNDAILKYYERFLKDKLENLEPINIAKRLRKIIKMANQQNQTDIEELVLSKKYRDEITRFLPYFHHTDKMYHIEEIQGGNNYSEKIFTRFTQEELDHFDVTEKDDQYINRINILNMDNMDIFMMLEQLGYVVDELTRTQIIEFLVGLGVKNIVSLDLACSITDSNERTTRRIRRNIY